MSGQVLMPLDPPLFERFDEELFNYCREDDYTALYSAFVQRFGKFPAGKFLDRSEAVNLARNALADEHMMGRVSRRGIRALCEAVMAMDAELGAK